MLSRSFGDADLTNKQTYILINDVVVHSRVSRQDLHQCLDDFGTGKKLKICLQKTTKYTIPYSRKFRK